MRHGPCLLRLLIPVAATLVGCGDDLRVPAVPVISGTATLTLAEDNGELVFVRGDETLLTFHADAFQVGTVDDLDAGDSFDPYWLFVESAPPPPEGFAWRALPRGGRMKVLSSRTDKLVLEVAQAKVTFTPGPPGCFDVHLEPRDADGVAYLRMRPDADATEGFYGLGEWGDTAMHRGKLRPMQLEVDTTMEGGIVENHVPVPLLLGTRGWGMFVESRRPGTFDVARESDTLIDVTYGTGHDSAAGLDVHLFSADHPLDLLAQYFELTGYPGLPAEWTYGPLLWRDDTTGQAQILDDITQIRARDLATSGIWFDRPYARGVNTFDFDPAKFATPKAMLQQLHDAGLRYGLWHAPYVAAANNDTDPAGTQHDFAVAHGFFPPVIGIPVNKWGDPIDFTNPDAYAWWQENLKTYTDPLPGGYGVEGFKLDYGEDIVVGLLGQRKPWKFADGSDELTMHHGYTLLYHQVYRELLAPSGGWLLTRTGRWGDQTKGMIVWPGDLDATFHPQGAPIGNQRAVGGLPTALSFGISLSASGFPFYSSDTGGYKHSPPNNEVWLRWVQASTIASAMEVGDSSSQMPWEFTTENGRTQQSLDIYRRYALLHMRLFPYAWSYARSMAETGHPIVRPFGLAHPEVGQHPSDQFLFGDWLLSAPVIEAGKTSREVWFPPGAWLSWWDASAYDGGASGTKATVPAPLDTLPLFIARGGIVPMLRDTIDTLSPVPSGSPIESYANDAGTLWVRVAPGPTRTAFSVFDGTRIAQTAGTSLTFTAGTKFTSGALFEVIATPAAPASVRAGGLPLAQAASLPALVAARDGWFWEGATGGTLWIKVPGTATITVP